jgi:hypothetical protein
MYIFETIENSRPHTSASLAAETTMNAWRHARWNPSKLTSLPAAFPHALYELYCRSGTETSFPGALAVHRGKESCGITH